VGDRHARSGSLSRIDHATRPREIPSDRTANQEADGSEHLGVWRHEVEFRQFLAKESSLSFIAYNLQKSMRILTRFLHSRRLFLHGIGLVHQSR
jgi:hypothetical protein